jgi:hypothetical protein
MSKRNRFKLGKQKKCWCGSGKHFKNCHGLLRHGIEPALPMVSNTVPLKAVNQTQPAQLPIQRPTDADKPWGVPGQEHKLVVSYRRNGEELPQHAVLEGSPGRYKVQQLLGKPGYTLTEEHVQSFIDGQVGDSHIVIAKPIMERVAATDVDRVLLQARTPTGTIEFTGIPNDDGRLGKLTAELYAPNMKSAETLAYNALNPFLSSWALHLDIPVHIETVQVTELSTGVSALRVYTPYFTMTFSGGITPILTDEFCNYASLYREAMNTNSNFYRYLCLFKIIESVTLRRSRIAQEAKDAGLEVPKRVREEVPKNNAELRELLKVIYPWRNLWDNFALSQMLPPEALGKKLANVRSTYLEPIRDAIAHALMRSGEIKMTIDNLDHVQLVNRWLPFCRVFARLMLHNDFPNEFQLQMDTNPVRMKVAMSSPYKGG